MLLSHDRRRIEHINVTYHPTAEWTAQQIEEAFPDNGTKPCFLIRDRDSVYGAAFQNQINTMGIEEIVTGRKHPWQNPYCERVVGSIRRECTDHVIPLGERHLLTTLRDYMTYYNEPRTHLSLNGNSPHPNL